MIRDAVVCVQTALGGRLVFLHIGGPALERQGAKWDPGLVHSAVRCALGSYIPFQNMDKKNQFHGIPLHNAQRARMSLFGPRVLAMGLCSGLA